MIKLLAIIQIVQGLAIVFFAWVCADIPHPVSDSSGIPILNATPPTSVGSIIWALMVPGVIVFAVGVIQSAKHTKLAGWQVFFGLAVILLSLYIINEESLAPGYVKFYAPVYWLTLFGMAISGVGIAQVRLKSPSSTNW